MEINSSHRWTVSLCKETQININLNVSPIEVSGLTVLRLPGKAD